jgi:ABC-type multidrug transport system fused ATPase/permease subunit
LAAFHGDLLWNSDDRSSHHYFSQTRQTGLSAAPIKPGKICVCADRLFGRYPNRQDFCDGSRSHLEKYKEQNDRMAVFEGKTAKYGLLTRPILHLMTTLCLAGVVLYGLLSLKLTVSQLIVFCGFLQMSYETIKKFGDENSNIQRGVVAAERMFEVLNLKPEIEDHAECDPAAWI